MPYDLTRESEIVAVQETVKDDLGIWVTNGAVWYQPIESHDKLKFVVACLQWFDVGDYEEERFLTPIHFDSEEQAQQVCDEIYLLFGEGSKRPLIGKVSPKMLWRLHQATISYGED